MPAAAYFILTAVIVTELHPCENLCFEKVLYGFGRNGEYIVVNGNTDAVAAVSYAEGSAEVDLILEVIFSD